MNKTILAMILSAVCSSGWWSGAMFNSEVCYIVATFSSLALFVWVVRETIITLDV